jgi:hypothetical protein
VRAASSLEEATRVFQNTYIRPAAQFAAPTLADCRNDGRFAHIAAIRRRVGERGRVFILIKMIDLPLANLASLSNVPIVKMRWRSVDELKLKKGEKASLELPGFDGRVWA